MSDHANKIAETIAEHCDIDKNRLSATPLLKGTKLPIHQIFSELSESSAIDDLQEELELSDENIGRIRLMLMDIANTFEEWKDERL